jgi:tetratricopeptide (TPR) repeat protein
MLGREETLAAELAGNESREYARALMRRTAWLGQRRDYPGFIRTTHAAGALAARWPGDAALAEIELQGGYSRYYFEGDSVDGAARVRRQLDLLKRTPSTGPRLLSTALRMHARMQFDAQNLDEALRAMREFEEHARVHFGLRSARRSYALTWLGYTLRESGRYTEGIDALREGATLAAGVRPYRQALHVEAMNALAQNLAIVGDTGTARAEFERALAIEERHPSANGYLLGLLLGSLGTLRGNEGDIQAASEYFARAIPIYERVFGAGSPKAVVMRKNSA